MSESSKHWMGFESFDALVEAGLREYEELQIAADSLRKKIDMEFDRVIHVHGEDLEP